jgi:hypothetical protein
MSDILKRKRELLALAERRKHELDKKFFTYGISADPNINIEREDLAEEIEKLRQEIHTLESQQSSSARSRVAAGRETDKRITTSPIKGDVVKDKTNTKNTLITSLVLLFITLILWIFPQSLSTPTVGIASALGLLGSFGVGMVITSNTGNTGYKDIFGAFGFLFVPSAIYYYAGLTIWSIVPISFIVFFVLFPIYSGAKKILANK